MKSRYSATLSMRYSGNMRNCSGASGRGRLLSVGQTTNRPDGVRRVLFEGIDETSEPCHQKTYVVCISPDQSRIEQLSVVCVNRRMQCRNVGLQSVLITGLACLVFLNRGFPLCLESRVLPQSATSRLDSLLSNRLLTLRLASALSLSRQCSSLREFGWI